MSNNPCGEPRDMDEYVKCLHQGGGDGDGAGDMVIFYTLYLVTDFNYQGVYDPEAGSGLEDPGAGTKVDTEAGESPYTFLFWGGVGILTLAVIG